MTLRLGFTNSPFTRTRPWLTASSASRRRKCGIHRTSRNPVPEYLVGLAVVSRSDECSYQLRDGSSSSSSSAKDNKASTFRAVTRLFEVGAFFAAA